jgi:MFS family permease
MPTQTDRDPAGGRDGTSVTAEPNRWAVLALLSVAQLMVVLDATIVTVALPSAQRALHFSPESRQWVVTAYALAFGSLLLVGGKVGDLFGRKWALIAGLVGFSGGLGGRWAGAIVYRARRRPGDAVRRAAGTRGAFAVDGHVRGTADWGRPFGIFGAVAGAAGAPGTGRLNAEKPMEGFAPKRREAAVIPGSGRPGRLR